MNRVTQLIALSDSIVRLCVPNGRSIAVSSHFDFGLILHEINAIKQNTVGSVPNEAIAEENQNQKIPCVGHYYEGTLKRPSTLIHYQMVHCNPLNGSFIKHSRFRVWYCVSSSEHNRVAGYWE